MKAIRLLAVIAILSVLAPALTASDAPATGEAQKRK